MIHETTRYRFSFVKAQSDVLEIKASDFSAAHAQADTIIVLNFNVLGVC
jgi:hypothetical protein